MPELPEVETIRRQLAPLVEERRLASVQVLDPRWSRPLAPSALERALTGRLIERLGRRGKYLVWDLGGDLHLVQHLRMTGSVLYEPDPEPAHVRVRIELGPAPGQRGRRRRARIAITDPRRFGTGELVEGGEALWEFFEQRLGLEPFDEGFTTGHLGALMRDRSAPVKALLLDQRKIAGVGNIYADEALFRARIHPLRRAGSLSREQRERLREGIVEALAEGIDARGASIDDFRHIDGFRGSFQDRFLVHLRAGEACVRCGRPIVKIVAAGRGTYVCENCQRPPRRRRAQST
jgi:formamidopyrimidine-DNA glycosylase